MLGFRCGWLILVMACDSGDPNVLATKQHGFLDIQARSGNVVWMTAESIMETSRSGGDANALAANLTGGQAPQAMFVDDSDVYWADTSSLLAAPIAGGTPRLVASIDAIGLVFAMTGDAEHVYVAALLGVWAVPKSGGSPTQLASFVPAQPILPSSPSGIAVDDTHVYWTNVGNVTFGGAVNDGTVMSVARSGGDVVTIATGQAYPQGVVSDGTNVFWIDEGDGNAATCDPGCVGGAIMIAPVGSASPSVWVSDPTVTRSMAPKLVLRDGFLYWSSYNGLFRVAAAGGHVDLVGPSVSTEGGFGVDDLYFYWSPDSSELDKQLLP